MRVGAKLTCLPDFMDIFKTRIRPVMAAHAMQLAGCFGKMRCRGSLLNICPLCIPDWPHSFNKCRKAAIWDAVMDVARHRPKECFLRFVGNLCQINRRLDCYNKLHTKCSLTTSAVYCRSSFFPLLGVEAGDGANRFVPLGLRQKVEWQIELGEGT